MDDKRVTADDIRIAKAIETGEGRVQESDASENWEVEPLDGLKLSPGFS